LIAGDLLKIVIEIPIAAGWANAKDGLCAAFNTSFQQKSGLRAAGHAKGGQCSLTARYPRSSNRPRGRCPWCHPPKKEAAVSGGFKII